VLSYETVRLATNIVQLLGLVTVFTLVTAVGGLAANHLPHFVASSDHVGSEVLLHVLGAVPSILAAAVTGALARFVFQIPHRGRWAVAVMAVIIVSFVTSYWPFWRSGYVKTEDFIGVSFAVALIVATYFGTYRISARLAETARPAG
jgi:hypothetical protein